MFSTKYFHSILRRIIALSKAVLPKAKKGPSMLEILERRRIDLAATEHELSSATNVRRLDAAIEKMNHTVIKATID